MPRVTETPEIVAQINYHQIIGFSVREDGTPRCKILILRGYQDDDGTITPVREDSHLVTGQTLADAMATVTTGGTIRDELKALLYEQCVEDGVIPADAVEV